MRSLVGLLFAALLLGAADTTRPNLRSNSELSGVDPLVSALGCFRPALAQLYLLKFQVGLESGPRAALLDDAHMVMSLWPDSDILWAWFADYFVRDLPPESATYLERLDWARAGFRLLDRGLDRLPRSALLHYRKAHALWTYALDYPALLGALGWVADSSPEAAVLHLFSQAVELAPVDAPLAEFSRMDLVSLLLGLLAQPELPAGLREEVRRRALKLLRDPEIKVVQSQALQAALRSETGEKDG